MSTDLKKVVILVLKSEGTKTRLDVRDEIIATAKTLGDITVIDAPKDIHIALIECTETVEQQLKKMFLSAVFEEERVYSIPRSPLSKPPRQKFN